MKIATIAGLVALSLFTAGCNSGCAPIQAVTSDKPLAGNTVIDEKALYIATAAQFGADKAAEQAVLNGVLKPGSAEALRIEGYLQKSYQAILAARQAKKAGDATTFSSRVQAAQDFASEAWKLIP